MRVERSILFVKYLTPILGSVYGLLMSICSPIQSPDYPPLLCLNIFIQMLFGGCKSNAKDPHLYPPLFIPPIQHRTQRGGEQSLKHCLYQILMHMEQEGEKTDSYQSWEQRITLHEKIKVRRAKASCLSCNACKSVLGSNLDISTRLPPDDQPASANAFIHFKCHTECLYSICICNNNVLLCGSFNEPSTTIQSP